MHVDNALTGPDENGAYHFLADGVAVDFPLYDNGGQFVEVTPAAYGFKIWQTGGGCTAWRREFTLNGQPVYMLITSPNDATHEMSAEEGAGMGVYTEEGDFVVWNVRESDDGFIVSDVYAEGVLPGAAK